MIINIILLWKLLYIYENQYIKKFEKIKNKNTWFKLKNGYIISSPSIHILSNYNKLLW